jgi:acyl transferase domain-containing protein/NAD(P)-dependent dehydrogenase (short-subunit alcohol dehydrogenase family)
MIGQIAALRSELTSMEQLHRDVTLGATSWLGGVKPLPAHVARWSDSIAIVGIACIYPGAPDLHAYFRNILLNTDCVTEVPPERWKPETYFDPNNRKDSTPSRWGGFIGQQRFNPKEFGIPPLSLASIDVAQLLMLLTVKRALADAGLSPDTLDGDRTSVVLGAEAGGEMIAGYSLRTYCQQLFGKLPPELDALLPAFTEDSFPGMLGNVIAGRVSNRLGLGGINHTVQAACASSLAAVEVACKELLVGNSDVVISGAADLQNSVLHYLLFASVRALSSTGRCRSFDDSADGIVLGEGVAAVVLKRLSDARRDGDRVYAVIESVAGSSDGRNLGLTAPSKQGQELAMSRAYERASVDPADLGLIEAHGTGTVLGDRTELDCLTEFMTTSGALPASCTLGSVKSQIGHTKNAAGLAGLIKAALAIHYGVLPPTQHIQQPNAFYRPSRSPFLFRRCSAPWLTPQRRAGVSAFGFGGTNFHAVLSRAPTRRTPVIPAWPCELFVFRGENHDDAYARATQLTRLAVDDAPYTLAELAASAAQFPAASPVQIAIVAESPSDLRKKLERQAKHSGGGVHFAPKHRLDGKIAFLFPGQGSQRTQMLADIFVHFPALRHWLERDLELGAKLYPGAAFDADGELIQQRNLSDTRTAQPALGSVEMAMAELLQILGLRADMAGGHSYGEVAALWYAGVLPGETMPEVSRARAQAMLDAIDGDPGTMAVVIATAVDVEPLVRDLGVVVANLNAPKQIVVSGATTAMDQAEQRLAAAGLQTKRIPVAAAFHSPLLAGADERFRSTLDKLQIAASRIPVWSNVTARCHSAGADTIRALLAQQLVSPVRFEPQIHDMYDAGARIFVEVGPGNVLSGLVGSILEGKPHCVVATDRPGVHGIQALLNALAVLSVHGVALDLSALFAERVTQLVDLERTEPPRPSSSEWLVDGHRAVPVQGEPPAHGFKPLTSRVLPGLLPDASAQLASARDGAVLQYLNITRDLIESQRQVMVSFLGGTVPAVPSAALDEAGAHAAPALAGAAPSSEPVAAASEPLNPLQLLVSILSERTGYPPEMLEPDLDLEADLGIDSIKRTEILGLLAERLNLRKAMLAGPAREALSKQRTLAQLGQWLETSLGMAASTAGESMDRREEGERSVARAGNGVDLSHEPATAVQRFSIESCEAEAAGEPVPIADKRFVVTADLLGIRCALAAEFEKCGAVLLDSPQVLHVKEPIDGLVYLDALDAHSDPAKSLLPAVQHALKLGATNIVAVTGFGGEFGLNGGKGRGAGGVSGFLKSIAQERPDVRVRCIDLDRESTPTLLAQQIVAELGRNAKDVEVGYRGERRYGIHLVPRERTGVASLQLTRDAVVLITGGARGITAQLAYELASKTGCRLELIGTTRQRVEPEDADIAGCADAKALRTILARKSGPTARPNKIEASCKQILAEREIALTLRGLSQKASSVKYHCADVRDEAAVARVIANVYERWNRLDVIIHGAGILDDGLLEKKSDESFARVYDTKVLGARWLLACTREDTRMVVFCSSISSVFGNRGQTDYAAANDYLDKLALTLNGKNGRRALSINWGPWSGVGMVSKELEAMYRQRGVGLIEPRQGAREFVDELFSGTGAQVVLMASNVPSANHG